MAKKAATKAEKKTKDAKRGGSRPGTKKNCWATTAEEGVILLLYIIQIPDDDPRTTTKSAKAKKKTGKEAKK
jgi:hypothetical protein